VWRGEGEEEEKEEECLGDAECIRIQWIL